jgi:hypothetical protein
VFCPPIKKEQNRKFLFNLTFQTPLRSFGSAFLMLQSGSECALHTLIHTFAILNQPQYHVFSQEQETANFDSAICLP